MFKQADDDYPEFVPIEEITTTDPMLETVSSDLISNSIEQKADQIPEETTVFLEQSPESARFQIHFTIIQDEFPIIVLNCSGDMIGSSCLILHNTFKMCSAKELPFIIVDMTNVSSVAKEVWEYFSSKATKIQKSNGILLFSGIQSSVLSETTDFHKMNICNCETVETCCLVIRNLVPEHEKSFYFPKQKKNLKTKVINQPSSSANISDINDSFVIDDAVHEKEHIKVDDSMSISYSIPSYMQIDVDESMSIDYSVITEESTEVLVNIDDSMSVDFSTNSENQTTDKNISVAESTNAIKMIEDEKFHQYHTDHTGNEKLLFVDKLLDSNAKPSSRLFFDPKEYTLPEKIHIIIAHYGPCSFGEIKNKLNSKDFGADKINAIDLYKLLKSMNLDSTKKRIRYYRSC
jgi:hypothetical protein